MKYTMIVSVRDRSAVGVFRDKEFTIEGDANSTPNQLRETWRALYGDMYEWNATKSINGWQTFNQLERMDTPLAELLKN